MRWYLWVVNGPIEQNGFEQIPRSQTEESLAGLVAVTIFGGGFISYVLATIAPVQFWHATFWGSLVFFVAFAIWWSRRAARKVNQPAAFIDVTDDTITISQPEKVSTLKCEDVCFIRAEANRHVQFIELNTETDQVKIRLATRAGDACVRYLHSKCEYAAYMDRQNKEHFPAKLDRADSIWNWRQKHHWRSGIDSFAGGATVSFAMAAYLWIEPQFSLTAFAGGLTGIGLFVAGALRLVRWRTRGQKMLQLKDAGDYEGVLRLIVGK